MRGLITKAALIQWCKLSDDDIDKLYYQVRTTISRNIYVREYTKRVNYGFMKHRIDKVYMVYIMDAAGTKSKMQGNATIVNFPEHGYKALPKAIVMAWLLGLINGAKKKF